MKQYLNIYCSRCGRLLVDSGAGWARCQACTNDAQEVGKMLEAGDASTQQVVVPSGYEVD